ncbi:MAG: right-handed parallel beta-helix repeat-containing protein [Anaerolineae bacterium]|nr:right-handed parallel beta-helix repeat-containing protein [Anaerolineae bacterium]
MFKKHFGTNSLRWLLALVVLLLSACGNIEEPDSPAASPPPAGDGAPLTPPPMADPIRPEECTAYVSTNGSDEETGTETNPWATFQHAADMVEPGATVCFRGGTYATAETHLSQSGNSEGLISFIAYPGEAPILDGESSANQLLILTQHTSYVRISGFTLQNFNIWGLELSGENRHVQLDHLHISGGEAAIHFTYGESVESAPSEGPVEYITLQDSIVHDSIYSAVDCTPGPCNHMVIQRVEIYNTGRGAESFYGSDGLEFARGYPVLVEDCYVHDNGGDGIDLNSRDRQGNATGVIVRRNLVVRNALNGIKLWAGGRIENNVLWGQGNCAIWTGSFPCAMEVVNNTVAYNMWNPASERNWSLVVGYPEEMDSPPVSLILENNIFASNAEPLEGGATGIYLGPGVKLLRERHNLFWSREEGEITAEFVTGRDSDFSRAEIADGTWAAVTGQGQGEITEDPRLVSSWPNADLHLQAGSPAVNAGSADGAPDDDAEGHNRDNTPDLGAYECIQ